MAVASSTCLPRRGNMMVRGATGAHPRIDFGQFTLPEPTDLMGRQPLMLDPTIDRVFGNPEVRRNLVDGDPRFGHQCSLPVTQYRSLSSDNGYVGKRNSHDYSNYGRGRQ